ncbi:energy transducer TonB [Acidipila sp. EB88]|uniref:energy transducer TonB n=1 Tax=Acidipila sp. EB88 TaxID=2305226 RepID=UPI000F602854|nr:energy transducer TonB [Acidipila sp. EB88]RRA47179.1 energy transducer TonB [Acidipila sp. EB88]
MSPELLTPTEEAETRTGRLDHTELMPAGTEGSVWESLVSNLRDVFRPEKLPPLVLTSTPVEVKDPFAEKRSPLSSGLAILIYALLLLILFFLPKKHVVQVKEATVIPMDISAFLPKTPVPTRPAGGGGGGGAHEITPPTKGKLPDFSKTQITPPQILKIDHPKLPVPATVVMPQMKMPDTNLPNVGLPQASAVTLSAGSGSGSGIGQGSGGGLGIGHGNGIGPGSDGGTGGGAYHVGGGISSPKVIYAVDPEFSDEARRQKYQGVVTLTLIVDAQGSPQRVRVARALGMGLDEKAIEAVRQYKFRPAMKDGKPVPVEINIEVNFQLF